MSRIALIATRHSRIKTRKKLLPLCGEWDGWPPLSAALRADNGWPHAVCAGVNTGLAERRCAAGRLSEVVHEYEEGKRD